MSYSGNDAHVKRLACQIFTQLPEGKEDALMVLSYAQNLVFNWPNCGDEDGTVIQLFAAGEKSREGG